MFKVYRVFWGGYLGYESMLTLDLLVRFLTTTCGLHFVNGERMMIESPYVVDLSEGYCIMPIVEVKHTRVKGGASISKIYNEVIEKPYQSNILLAQ
jgi:hypothetical protein